MFLKMDTGMQSQKINPLDILWTTLNLWHKN